MLLVENLPQPIGRVDIGQANAREARLQLESPRRVQCRRIAAAVSRRAELGGIFRTCDGWEVAG